MSKFYIAPQNVVYGRNIFPTFGKYVRGFGGHLTIITDEKVFPLINVALESLDSEKIEYSIISSSGEASYDEINNLEKKVLANGSSAIIGFGGGKIQDIVKYVGFLANIKIVTVPTAPSNCAAWSSHSAIYTNEGIALEYAPIYKNPDLIIVDEEILITAPEKLFLAGIGDTLAKWIETEAFTKGLEEHSTEIETAIYLAKKTFEDIIEFGEEALNDYRNKKISPKLSKIFKHIIVNSGLIGGIGGESCRAVGAHSVNNGFTIFPEFNKNNLHGETVAYGNVVQLILDKADSQKIDLLLSFYKKVGLPLTLEDLGYSGINFTKLRKIVEKTLDKEETIWNLSYEVSKEELFEAIIIADKLGQEKLA